MTHEGGLEHLLQVEFHIVLELLSKAFGNFEKSQKTHDHMIQRTEPDTALRVHEMTISIHMQCKNTLKLKYD